MSNYYQKKDSKIAIMSVLADKGWKIYGYKPDKSDPYTDYYSPADWSGVCEKDGYVLLVDQYSTHYSNYQVKKYNYNVKGTSADNRKKIEKLMATMNDSAATENEKEVCKRKIEALEGKEPNKPTYTVLETYPTFSFANPKACTWHIEKDGQIIAKGKGLTTVYECNSRENTKANAEKFVAKIEKHIADNTQLEAVQQKVIKKVIKPVLVANRQTIQEGDVLSFDYHGHFWKVISVYTRKDGKVCATYELLGSVKRGYQQLKNASRYYDYMNTLEKNVQAGKVKIHTLQEVEEVTYKTVYKKAQRKAEQPKAQDENLLSGEVEENQTTQESTVQSNNGITYETGTGSKGNGIEINFTSKPSEEIRNQMKAIGFRWGGKNRASIWWAVLNNERLELAKQLSGENNTTEAQTQPEPVEVVEATQEQNEASTEQNENNLIGRKVFGNWGVMHGWDYGTITNVETDTIGTDIIVKWEDNHEERIDINNIIIVDEYTNIDAVGIYLLPIEETTEQNETNDSVYSELVIDQLLDKATSIVTDLNAQNYSTMSPEQKNSYLSQLSEYINNNGLNIDILLSHIPMYSLLCEALEDVKQGKVFNSEPEQTDSKFYIGQEFKNSVNDDFPFFKLIKITESLSGLKFYRLQSIYDNDLEIVLHEEDLYPYTPKEAKPETQEEPQNSNNSDNMNEWEGSEDQTFIFDNNNQEAIDLQYFSTAPTTDDILSAFDDIDLTEGNNSIITTEDREHCEQLEKQYNQLKTIYELTMEHLELNQESNKYIDNFRDFNPLKERLEQAKNSFLIDVLAHFKEKYSIKIDYYELEKKYKNKPLTLDTILDEIILILDGLTFSELEAQQVAETMRSSVNYNKISVKNDKISIPDYFYVVYENYGTPNFKLSYGQYEKVEALFKAIAHHNSIDYKELDELERTIKHKYNEDVFTIHELDLNKIKFIKLYKNGKIDIVFNGSQYAKEFHNQYLQK